MKNKFVSIITVNFNGERYLKNFLESTLNLNYPKECYEVVVVDNGSSDGSVEFIEEHFPTVTVLKLRKNIGFGRGNNFGIKNSRGELVFLVNNDTILDPDSLNNAVLTLNRWSRKGKVAAINSKLVLVDKYVPLIIGEAFYSDSKVPVEAQGFSDHVFVSSNEIVNYFIEKVYVPISYRFSGDLSVNLKLKPYKRNEYEVWLSDKLIYQGSLKSLSKEVEVNFTIRNVDVGKMGLNLIQNAGNFYFRDGHGRDRGALVIKQRQFYEPDRGQYDKEESIPGFCGAGTLISKKALEDVGYFDEKFFMYYEDSDLSYRFREAGWDIIYSPKSVIRHIHAGSSEEWSNFFVFNAERGRLIFLSKHWPRSKALWQWCKYIVVNTIAVPFYKRSLKLLILRLKVNISVILPFIVGLLSFRRMSKKQYADLL